MFGYDAQHSHWNRAETTLRPPLKLLARFSIPGMTIDSLSAAAGRLFAGGMNRQKRNEVVALDAVNGKVVWSFTLDGGGAMDVTPLYVGGTVCVGGQGDDNLYALDVNTGKLKWRIPGAVSLYTNHPIVWGRIVYYVAISTLIALDPLRGSRLWSFQLPSGLRTQTSPVASGPYLAVVDAPRKDSDEGTLHIVDARTGSLVRRIGVPAQGITYPIAAEKNIIAASGREVACLNVSSGSLLWRTQLLRGDAWGAMLACSGTSVFVRLTQASGEGQGLLYSLDRDSGKTQWRFPTGGGSARRPVIANNLVYVTKSNPPRVVGVDMKMGKEVWGEDLLSGPTGDPIVAYGFLYVPVEGTIYVFG
jgi:outer membrane protein assembly factor BamB